VEKIAAELSRRWPQVLTRHNELPEEEGRLTAPQFGAS
jgi:hypothetical protein